MISRFTVNSLILITGFGFTALALLIDLITEKVDLVSALSVGMHWGHQIIAGCLLSGFMAIALYFGCRRLELFRDLSELSRKVFSDLNLSILQILGLSLAAGVGEEILFRGVIQPIIGILPASVIFAGLHIGFNLRIRVYRSYFIVALTVSIILGIMSLFLGLLTAISAHFMWDFTMLLLMRIDKTGTQVSLRKKDPDEMNGDQSEQ